LADAGLYHVKGEYMTLVRVVQLFSIAAVLVFAAMSSPADAACACSRVGQSNGYYANPSAAYGAYGYGATYGAQQPQAQPVRSKTGKSKKKASKSKPVAQ
jgi:hypothetical protein